MYTWGYLKDVILSKLDLEEPEAENMGYLNCFAFYANEAMTQICSSVKPKRTFHEFTASANHMEQMPEDFISFGDDVNTVCYNNNLYVANDEDFEYYGFKHILCKIGGKYRISYNARWVDTFVGMSNDAYLDVPIDVLECIPSYVASQCIRIDDEQKASIFRNEYEILLARIDDTDFKNTKTFKIGGDW